MRPSWPHTAFSSALVPCNTSFPIDKGVDRISEVRPEEPLKDWDCQKRCISPNLRFQRQVNLVRIWLEDNRRCLIKECKRNWKLRVSANEQINRAKIILDA